MQLAPELCALMTDVKLALMVSATSHHPLLVRHTVASHSNLGVCAHVKMSGVPIATGAATVRREVRVRVTRDHHVQKLHRLVLFVLILIDVLVESEEKRGKTCTHKGENHIDPHVLGSKVGTATN